MLVFIWNRKRQQLHEATTRKRKPGSAYLSAFTCRCKHTYDVVILDRQHICPGCGFVNGVKGAEEAT